MSVRAVAIAVSLYGTGAVQAGVAIATVAVADVGNVAAPSGIGRVNYAYRIGTYEVTAGQYTAFLNAVARDDTHGLYNPDQANREYGSGIARSGAQGAYVYSVDAAFENRPVNGVSMWDACRFANWLHNGQPTGEQVARTTEDGAYTLSAAGIAANTVARNPGWRWAIPSENEWVKAAYYKGGGASSGYWSYPTRSDTPPGRDLLDVSGNNATSTGGAGTGPIQPPYYTTTVGLYHNSASPYGTFDMGGNVWERTEDVIFGTMRGLRGGAYNMSAGWQRFNLQNFTRPELEDSTFGFRVVAVPTPPLAPIAMWWCFACRRPQRCQLVGLSPAQGKGSRHDHSSRIDPGHR